MAQHWISHPTIMEGKTVNLLPLEEMHFDELFLAASDKELWKLIPTDCSERKTFDLMYAQSLLDRDKGLEYPFIISHKSTNKIIGSTRLFDIHPSDKKLEIGWTWIVKNYWGTDVNLECKLLLLKFCFETLHANRVQLKTKDTNFRSRKAIEKIGGIFEGILRKDRIQSDGTTRNTAYYSILDEEWALVKQNLSNQIAEKRKDR